MARLARLAMYTGIAVCVVALSKLHAVAHEYSWSGSARAAWAAAFVFLLGVAVYSLGFPERAQRWRPAALRATLACLIAVAGVSAVQLVVGDALLPRFVVIGSAVILVPWFVLCGALATDAETRDGNRDRVVVVAASSELETLEEDLRSSPEKPALVVSWLTPAEAYSTGQGARRPLVDVAHELHASVVVLSRAAQSDEDIVVQASILHGEGMRIRTLSLFYEQWLGKLPIAELERVSLLFDIGELHATGYARVKRLVDILLAAVGLVGLVVLTPFVLLGNAFASRGPLFYRQARVGRNGLTFEIVKFRTMKPVREAMPSRTASDDARISRFGRLLRRTHLDELPQVVNVLRGDLSIVGPRPEQIQFVDELTDKIPFYPLRHLVRPGLTGWAQVKYSYAGDESEALQKLQYEFYYLRRQSMSLDLRIVGRTLREVVGGGGR
jgi:lipopolysaccharide/colanic/teichoic acid biosynthesis glycosyltransferase